MRKLLLLLVLALLVGALAVWVLQFGSGYVLLSFAELTIEMSAWTGLIIYLAATVLLFWLLLTWRWIVSAGGFRSWWRNRRSARNQNQTAEGLLLFAGDDWQEAAKLLSQSADKSSMPVVNLLFAARAAADNEQFDQARQILQRLKVSYPKSRFVADKALAETHLLQERPEEALKILQAVYAENPRDKGLLRLLADAHYLSENWTAAQKMLGDLKRFQAVNDQDLANLEQDVYCNLLDSSGLNSRGTISEKRVQLEDIWYLIPRKHQREPQIIACYAASLGRVKLTDKQQVLLTKSLNRQWHPQLVTQFGELESESPEKQLMVAEKWLVQHGEDADLLLALGRICQRLKFWGKAKDYFTTAVKLRPSVQGSIYLASVLEKIGDSNASAEAYKQGLLAALEQEPLND
ncbi:hemY protein [marine gamma proteobacterium HTCC2207]|uniref:HemY protein n=1 Tax=gamma proteobacterium HTCC2207 TaxID=314287 RepID=Q1YST8_9GAMM|nr:hemY protein [marine gamma proteobacterium HTCC2207] [gamma proteobacterium HTCC2207]